MSDQDDILVGFPSQSPKSSVQRGKENVFTNYLQCTAAPFKKKDVVSDDERISACIPPAVRGF